MSVLIGKTAARIAQQIRQVIAKANAELKKEGPPNPKKINELRKDYKSLDNALPLAEEGEKLRKASQDNTPIMDRGGQGTTRSIGAGESAQSKGTTPFRKESSKKWFKVEEGIDEGRKSYGRKQAEATLEDAVESDKSVPFKTGRSKEDDKAIKAFKGKVKRAGKESLRTSKRKVKIPRGKKNYILKNEEVKDSLEKTRKKSVRIGKRKPKVPEGKATFKKPREKPSSLDKQKKAIVRQGKKELAKNPLNPNTSKVVRLREQYKTLNNLSNEVIDLVNESDLKKQTTEANRLKKLVGRYTTTQINDIMGSSGDFSKGRSSGEFKSGSRGDGKYIPRSDEVGAPYPSRKANPEQVALKRKRPRKNRSQIAKNAQDAPVALQNLLVKLGIIKRSELKSSYVPKKTKTKPYKPTSQARKGKPTPTPAKSKVQEQKEAASKARNLQQKSVFNKIKTLTPLIKKNGAARYQKRIDSINKDIVRLGMQRDATLDSAPARYRAKDLKVFKKKGGKVLKAKPKRKVTIVKRTTTAPRKRAALRGYGKALRGF